MTIVFKKEKVQQMPETGPERCIWPYCSLTSDQKWSQWLSRSHSYGRETGRKGWGNDYTRTRLKIRSNGFKFDEAKCWIKSSSVCTEKVRRKSWFGALFPIFLANYKKQTKKKVEWLKTFAHYCILWLRSMHFLSLTDFSLDFRQLHN